MLFFFGNTQGEHPTLNKSCFSSEHISYELTEYMLDIIYYIVINISWFLKKKKKKKMGSKNYDLKLRFILKFVFII
jgi:hypothetical protein